MDHLLQCFVAVAVALYSSTVLPKTTTHAADSRPPNVILILADDLCAGDLSSANGGISRTPNLDRLAEQSVRFQNAYSASCVCAPARAALLTGRYPHRTGVVTLNMNRYPAMTRLNEGETTLADVLKDNGYATGLIGKWHCGLGKQYHPMQRGFQEFEGFGGSEELSYFDYSLDINGDRTDVDDDYLTDDLSRRAIAFVNRHRERPFFLHLAHYAPHRPIEAPGELIQSYRDQGLDESTATIYAMIEVMDRGIGELLAALDRLKLTDQTVVLFASDNGPDPLTGSRFNHNRRGMKYDVYEGGIRVPLFVRYPPTLTPGDRRQLVHFVDLFPTILDICEIAFQPKLPIDGISFLPVLKDTSTQHARPQFWQWNRGRPNFTHNAAMRDGPWKLVRPFVNRKANPSDAEERPVLFNLDDDPAEKQDRAKQNQARYQEMLKQLERWSRAVEKSRTRSLE